MKILLVDDNKYILEALESGIDYQSLGFEEFFTARNMEGALDILQREKIQVVVTDIEMPNRTGLELLDWINKNIPLVVTIFCTSYANFDYAKKAVELHSFEYYLKPIQFEELYLILERAVEESKRRKRIEEKSQMGDQWFKNMGENKKHFWIEALLMVYTYSEEELEELALSRHLPYRNEDEFTLALVKFTKENSRMEYLNFSMEQFALTNILEELFDRESLQLEAFIKSEYDAWILVLSGGEKESSISCGETFKRVLSQVEQVLECQMGIYYYVNQPLCEIRTGYLTLEQSYLSQPAGQGEIKAYEESSMTWLEDDSEETDSAVEKLKEYIDVHYQERITRENMGSIVFYNTAYAAKLFKKKYGQSIGSYILDCRMERAKEMLQNSSLSVSEVAMKIGYDNFPYFSRLFKKKTGYAPKDYKKAEKK
ncbi:response regulator transcription factor [Anaerocolumna jejuensis]|uniref:response regulator transcription factor n=1 Tax=Anaerocolumna jejuensis TaxID=259063 RepID=UPI003F7BC3E7